MMRGLVDAVLAGEPGAHRVLRDALMEREARRIEVYPGQPNLLARTMLSALGEDGARAVLGELLEAWLAEIDEELGEPGDWTAAVEGEDLAGLRALEATLPEGLDPLPRAGLTQRETVGLWLGLLRGAASALASGGRVEPYAGPLGEVRAICWWVAACRDGFDLDACAWFFQELGEGRQLTGTFDRRRLAELPIAPEALARAAARRLEAARA